MAADWLPIGSFLQNADAESVIQVAGGYVAGREDVILLENFPRLDAVVRGDPERPVDALLRHGSTRPIPLLEGLTVRSARGDPCRAPYQGPDPELALPRAANDLFDERRLTSGQKILLSRGCQDDCDYCGLQFALGGNTADRWRGRSAAEIVDEIDFYHRLGVGRFEFQANVFFGYDERGTRLVREVCEAILDRRLRVSFRFITHPHHLLRNRTLLPLLVEAGLEHVGLGLDSGSPTALGRYGVSFSIEDGIEALRLINLHGIEVTPGFIFYDPLAAWSEIREQLTFLRRIAPLFDHRARTYAAILEKELFNQHLKVHRHTPMAARLVRRGVVVEEPEHGQYVLCFSDPQVAMFHRLHHQVTHDLFAPLRPLTWRKRSTTTFPYLKLLPLDLLDLVAERIEEGSTEWAQVVWELSAWLAKRLASDFDAMKGLVEWPRGEPRSLSELLPPS
jgi:hypothetical protein